MPAAPMTPRQRVLAVMTGQTPDRVPALADLSWWHAAHGGGKFIPSSAGNDRRVAALLQLHRRLNVAIHVNLGAFYREKHPDSVRVESGIRGEDFVHRIQTPVGSLEEVRMWSPDDWSWPIVHRMVRSVDDLKTVRYLFEHVAYETDWDAYAQIDRQVGDIGLPFVQAPYTAMGFMMSRYAGVEQTVMLSLDAPDELDLTVRTINAAHERVFRLLAAGPGPVLFVSDNLSSDVQSPPWFARYSGDHYAMMARVAHEHGKPLSVHIDGRLRGLLGATSQRGIDGADAVTPAPWGDLTPQQCRDEAGPGMVLSGGIPPDSFAASVPLKVFDQQVEAWLGLRKQSPALIIAPGDQLPPDGELDRITRMVDMAEAAEL